MCQREREAVKTFYITLVYSIDPFLSIRFPWYYWRSSAKAWRSGSVVAQTHFTTIPRVTVQCVHVTLVNELNRSSGSALDLQFDNTVETARCSGRKGSIMKRCFYFFLFFLIVSKLSNSMRVSPWFCSQLPVSSPVRHERRLLRARASRARRFRYRQLVRLFSTRKT